MEKAERRGWTDAEDAVINEGREQNQTYDQIAEQLGRTRSAVSVRAYQLRQAAKAVGSATPAAAAAPAQANLPSVDAPAAAPKKRGRPPKAKPEVEAAETAAPVAQETAAVAPKKRGRPPKAATAPAVEKAAPVAAPVPAPVAAAPKPRTPRAVATPAPAQLAPAPAPKASNGNGTKPVGAVSLPAGLLLGDYKLSVEGASVALVPGGGLRFDFGGGRFAEVSAA